MLAKASRGIGYQSQGACKPEVEYRSFVGNSARIVKFRSDFGRHVAIVLCGNNKIAFIYVYPNSNAKLRYAVFYVEPGGCRERQQSDDSWYRICDVAHCKSPPLSAFDLGRWKADYAQCKTVYDRSEALLRLHRVPSSYEKLKPDPPFYTRGKAPGAIVVKRNKAFWAMVPDGTPAKRLSITVPSWCVT
jgi:hypothetical protein